MRTASFDVSGDLSRDVSGTDRIGEPATYRDEDFPGCESFHLPADELDDYEYRLEFWDGAILDWLVHNAYQLNLRGESMRKTRGPLNQTDHFTP